ncbi:MAG: exo-alpha-sialidase [Ignavibacteria bacterium]|nr:exo-alpha-sialidase [Ignavibacteria bacterium]
MRTINFLAAAALMIFFININIAQWQNDVMLTFDPAVSTTSYNNATCLASAGNTLHLAWEETRDGNNEIYYKRSIDGGTTWGADTRITNDTNYSQKPSIAVSGVVLHVVWTETRDGNAEIYYKRSPNGGTTWERIQD